jgi:hypothetical protein
MRDMNDATTKPARFTETDAASLLGCSVKSLRSRMVALGYVKICSRCCGTGRYSYNQMDGDRCYGCNGRGKSLLPVTRKLALEMKARQDAGELADYFARCQRNAEARAALLPLCVEIDTLWTTSHIGAAYTRASHNRGRGGPVLCTRRRWDHIPELGRGGWVGEDWDSPLMLAQCLINDLWGAMKDTERAVKRGDVADPIAARTELTWILDTLRAVLAHVTPEQIRAWGFAV